MSLKIDVLKNEIDNLQNLTVRNEVAEKILRDIGKENEYQIENLQNIKIYFIDSDDRERAVVLLDFGLENNVVAVYTEQGNVYEYVSELDLFYQVNNIQFLPIVTEDKNAIIVNEYVNQGLGAYEFSEWIKGYILENGIYRQVLEVEGDVDSYWNKTWDNPEFTGLKEWEQVQQHVTFNWKTDFKGNPLLEIHKKQSFWEADGNGRKTIPEQSKFEKTNERDILESYFWSDDWQRFILGEAIEKPSQEVVAILEIRDHSPYALAGFLDDTFVVENVEGQQYLVEGKDLVQINRVVN